MNLSAYVSLITPRMKANYQAFGVLFFIFDIVVRLRRVNTAAHDEGCYLCDGVIVARVDRDC